MQLKINTSTNLEMSEPEFQGQYCTIIRRKPLDKVSCTKACQRGAGKNCPAVRSEAETCHLTASSPSIYHTLSAECFPCTFLSN